MLEKLFNDKRFIFIFTFLIEFILCIISINNQYKGSFLFPELAMAPVLGLMFGPVGALGEASGCLFYDILHGYSIVPSLLDFGILVFIGIITYKLWYTPIGKKEVTYLSIDSSHNLFKFIVIMFIISNIFMVLLTLIMTICPEITEIYSISQSFNVFPYSLNMFCFPLLFGIVFTKIFQMLKIPLQTPKKWISLIDIDNKYFAWAFVLIVVFTIINTILTMFTGNLISLKLIFCSITLLVTILFCINKLDVEVKEKNIKYTTVEEIIFIFLLILAIVLFNLFNDFQGVIDFLLNNPNHEISMIATISSISVLVILLALIHTVFIEKTITNPLYDLIDVLNESKAQEVINPKREESPKLQSYLDRNDDISRLVNSFMLLKSNIGSYLTQIKETSAEKERIETEFNVASHIQTNMIKTNFEEFSRDRNFEIFGFMKPAREVGGDFYDFFNIDEENVGFAIGDVCGKGIPATLLMVKTMYLIRNHNENNEDPEKAMSAVNNLSCERNDESLFITTFFGRLNLKTGKLSFVNAGHNPPLIRRNDNGNNYFEYLNIPSNFVLGVFEENEYEKQELNLKPGDMIFLYTDGITEANNKHQETYGENHLKETLNKYKDKSLEEIIEKIENDVYDFCEGENQFDDMTMLIIKYTGCENDG